MAICYVVSIVWWLVLYRPSLRYLYTRKLPYIEGAGIPFGFHLRYWLTNSLWATGTILLLGLFVFVPFSWLIFANSVMTAVFAGALLTAFIISQTQILSHDGSAQGRLEYRYREYLFDHTQKMVLYVYLKEAPLPWDPEKYEGLTKMDGDDNLRLYANMRLATIAWKSTDYEKAARYLSECLSMAPRNSVVNFRLAVTYERIGNAERAIKHYEIAAEDPDNLEHVKEFCESRIQRVRTKGPREYSWRAGFRYF
jgi:tetratricopeptide (TPR) repeat protein